MEYTKPLARLIEYFQKLPSIGPKTAMRLAMHVVKMSENEVNNFANALIDAKTKISYCKTCFNMSCNDPCEICSDITRNKTLICVVGETKDLMAIEKTNEFHGLYHVLQGLISPIDGIGPEDLNLSGLIDRIKKEEKEIIIALSPSIEGEVTSMYIQKILEKYSVKVSRLSYGIPMGSEIEYLDPIMITKALEDRKVIS